MPIILELAEVGMGTGHPFLALAASGDARPGGLEAVLIYGNLIMNDRNVVDKYRVLSMDGLADADIRDVRFNSPAEHGEVALNALYGGRTLTITGRIEAYNVGKLRDMQQALRAAFVELEEKPLVFRTQDITKDVFINCRKVQGIAMTEVQSNPWPWRDFMVTLRASNPRFLSWNENLLQEDFFWTDLFTTDQLTAEYNFAEGAFSHWTVTGGVLGFQTGTSSLVYKNRSYADSEVVAKVTIGATPGNTFPGVVLKAKTPGAATSDLMLFEWQTGGSLVIYKRVSNAYNTMASVATGAAVANTSYWLRAYVVGNVVTFERWTTDPALGGSPATSLGYTLVSTEITQFGDGVFGYSGVRAGFVSGAMDLKFDDLKIEPRELSHVLSTVRNNGNFSAQPRIRIGGPITGTLVITNNTNGQTLSFTGLALTSGQWMEVDTAKRTVVRDNGSNLFSKLVIGSDWLELEPGYNDISVTAPSTDSNPYIWVFHRDTWM